MKSVQDHYDRHLGPVYSWMLGGAENAIERGAAELESIGITRSDGGLAVDLGAGFGVHAIPLARRGFNVLAVDSCAALLSELGAWKGPLSIAAVQTDLRSFPRHLPATPELILCMGDTINHLPDEESVEEVFERVSAALGMGGRFVVTFREHLDARAGEQRCISVRSDHERILTCFLEYTESRVKVHDLLHEWDGSAWQLTVSTYQKLRLSPRWIVGSLENNGFEVEKRPCASGMTCFVARRQ